MLTAIKHIPSEEATAALAAGVADVLCAGDVLALEGDLGAGKTTFVRALARALGADERLVSSPTFVMVNQYPVTRPDGAPARLVHVDAYRLHGPDDLDALGWDTFYDSSAGHARAGHILAVEWPGRIATALAGPAGTSPDHLATLRFAPTGEDSREVTLELPDSWQARPRVAPLIEREATRCRTTGRWVSPTAASYPFADEKARLADLNRWFTGSYGTSRPLTAQDLDDPAGPDAPGAPGRR
jgi:tRNA threonylcarbamoyl adenosine modification protein YjeE